MGVQQALLAGGGLGTVTLTNRTISTTVSSPDNATSTFTILSGGTTVPTKASEWLVGGSSTAYEVRATLNSGSLSTGTTGSWINCSTSPSWTRSQSVVGTSQADLTIEIREAASLSVVDSANVILNASVNP